MSLAVLPLAPRSMLSAHVLGAEPDGLVHQALVSLLSTNGVDVVDAAEGAADVAVLIDPDDDDWASAHAASVPVVLVEGRETSNDRVVDAVVRGAEAVVHSDAEPGELLDAIRLVALGGTLLSPAQVRAVAQMARKGGRRHEVRLTRRESEIIESIAAGDAVKQTARALGISAKTVENLQSRLFRKLGVHNRAQAVAQAHALGMV